MQMIGCETGNKRIEINKKNASEEALENSFLNDYVRTGFCANRKFL